jgi:hypothetical protein
MNGGMMKAAGPGAVAVLAGLLLSSGSVLAADLGGNCCADLEERVAELEATAARKGNRKVSLTITGQVNRMILYWDESSSNKSGTYAGIDNTNSSSRFWFTGDARIRPDLKAGYEFMVEWAGSSARSASVNADTVDGGTSGDGPLAIRTANWYLESTRLGRVTVGRLNFGGPVATIDLGGISVVASNSVGLIGGSFVGAGGFTLANFVGPSYGADRIEGIRWDSPSIGGFVAQASWGEDDVWSASLRYAGEFSGFRVAAGIGYQHRDPVNAAGDLDGTNGQRGENEWVGSVAVLHIPSGLFAQGHYAVGENLGAAVPFSTRDAHSYLIQAGISKNWTGMGNTNIYGEYGRFSDLAAAGSENTLWGVGVVQNIDAAAMELYLAYRHHATEATGFADEDLTLVIGGARIKF